MSLRPKPKGSAAKSKALASTLRRALDKDKSIGVDFYKVAIGDSKENHRLRMRQHTDSLKKEQQTI